MNCPSCAGELKPHPIGDVQAHECASCFGIWFEQGELSEAKDETNPDLNWMDTDLWKDHDQFTITASALKCPEDQEPMATLEYGDTGVLVDTCGKCRGVWLDQGEFESIIKALEDDLLAKPASEYAKESLREAGEVVTGDKGRLTEWHEFNTVTRLLQYRLLTEHPRLQQALLNFYSSSPFQ